VFLYVHFSGASSGQQQIIQRDDLRVRASFERRKLVLGLLNPINAGTNLSKKSGVSVTRAGRSVTDDTGPGRAVLHGAAAICRIGTEDLCDAALRGIWNPETK
jgi:hypothetical protein